jgi:hypothetical protein
VLKGLPIPEVYIHVQTDASGGSAYSVVDGQQRIRTLLNFTKGEFALLSEFTPEWSDRKFADLTDDLRQRYWSFSLVVRELHEASEADVRDLFQRLNRFVYALNPQELRNARFNGDFLHIATELAEDEFWAINRIVSPNDIRRMLDVQFVSELLVGLMAGPQNKTDYLDDYYDQYDTAFPDRAQWVRTFHTVQATLSDLVPDLPQSHWRKKSSYYSLFLVLGQLSASQAIQTLDRGKATNALHKFGSAVESALLKNPPTGLPPLSVRYADAVARAASDKDRRLARQRIILSVLGVKEPSSKA